MGNWESLTFPEGRFSEVVEEMEKPNLDGYELFTSYKGMYDIHRRKRASSGLYEYKVIGEDRDLDAAACSQVYRDLEYRKKWDSYVGELRPLDRRDGAELVYWQVKYPFPLTNRDYVYARQTKEFQSETLGKVWVTLCHSCTSIADYAKERKGVLRVDDYEQTLAICKRKEGTGSKLLMHYYDNPRGSIPAWLINYMAKTGVPGFIEQLKDTCKNYHKE